MTEIVTLSNIVPKRPSFTNVLYKKKGYRIWHNGWNTAIHLLLRFWQIHLHSKQFFGFIIHQVHKGQKHLKSKCDKKFVFSDYSQINAHSPNRMKVNIFQGQQKYWTLPTTKGCKYLQMHTKLTLNEKQLYMIFRGQWTFK